ILPLTSRLPSRLIATLLTDCVCPLRENFLALVGVPDLHHPIVAGAGEAFAVGTKRHAGDKVCVPLEGEQRSALVGVPDLHRLVFAAADEAFAVGTKRHTGDRGYVSLEREDFGALADVPHLDLT